MASTLLVVHSRAEVHQAIRNMVDPMGVCSAGDIVSAKEAASGQALSAMVLEHPFMGMEAPFLYTLLHQCGARCPVVVLAEDASELERAELSRVLPASCEVLATSDPVAVAVALQRLASTGVQPEPAVARLSPADAWFMKRLGASRLALRVDADSCAKWVEFDLPPQLIAELDGSETVAEILAGSGEGMPVTLDFLRWLYMADCLDVMGHVPASGVEASRWVPPEPPRPPDESSSLSDVAVPELLLALRRRGETGVAIMETGGWLMRIDIAHGEPSRAGGGPAETALGAVMVKLGQLDAVSHDDVLREYQGRVAERPDITLGDVAMHMGLISPSQLHAALAAQLEHKIRALVGATQGTFRFYRDDRAAMWGGIEHKPLEALLAEGLREHEDRRSDLVSAFVDREADNLVTALDGAMDVLLRLHLGARAQRLLRLLDGRTVRQALDESPMPPPEAELALYLLWAAGAVEISP